MKKKTIEDCQILVEKKGGALLTDIYVDSKSPLPCKCKVPEHPTWNTSYGKLQSGYWCPACSGNAKHDWNWLNNMIIKRGGVLISKEYLGMDHRYNIDCGGGHLYTPRGVDLYCGKWCGKCAKTAKKNKEWLDELAIKKNGLCLSKVYINNRTNYEWKCHLVKHIAWWAKADNIQRGQWCPLCANEEISKRFRDPNGLRKCQEWAKELGGECLSTEYLGMNKKLLWRDFKCGRTWDAIPNTIKVGHWCPFCPTLHSDPELEIYERVKKVYPDALSGPRRLLKTKTFEIDVYVPSKRKGVEFDGPRHDPESKIFNPKNQERDERKNKQAEEAGIELFRVKYNDFKKNPDLEFQKIFEFLT